MLNQINSEFSLICLISEKQGVDELESEHRITQNELPHTETIQEKECNLLPDNGETLGGKPTEGESQRELYPYSG